MIVIVQKHNKKLDSNKTEIAHRNIYGNSQTFKGAETGEKKIIFFLQSKHQHGTYSNVMCVPIAMIKCLDAILVT